MKYTSLAKRNPQHGLIHGMPKSGKSTLASQLAEAGFNLYWISLDNGHTILDKLSEAAKERVDIIVLPDTRYFPVAAVTCRRLFKLEACHICNKHGQVDCSNCKKDKSAEWTDWDFKKLGPNDVVVVDHISGLAESIMNNICAKDFAKDEEYKFNFNDYGAQGTVMHAFLGTVQTAPFHVLCLSHSLEVKAEDGVNILVPQVGTRAFSDTVGKYFDHVVYCHVLNGSHRAGSSTLYRAGVLTGSRSDVKIEAAAKDAKFPIAELFRTEGEGYYSAQAATTKETLTAALATVTKVEQPEVPVSDNKLPETPGSTITDEPVVQEPEKPAEQSVNTGTVNAPPLAVSGTKSYVDMSEAEYNALPIAEKVKARIARMNAKNGKA